MATTPAATTPERDRAKRGIQARQTAIKTLIENHQQEFDELHTKLRVELGLPPRSSGPSATELEDRIKRQRERLQKWEAELRLATR